MIIGEGFIKLVGDHIVRAEIRETNGGSEFAVLPNGLIIFPFAFEVLETYEVESEEDLTDIDRLLKERAALLATH